MQIIRTIKKMKQAIKIHAAEQIGFVPTMGFFHEGHLELMRQAHKENDITVVSVFVNPMQFGPNEDFESYPRDEQRDIELASENGADIIFMPSIEEMYPRSPIISMDILERTNVLCGKSRPGHFAGVVTVLSKLFHIIQPQKVYFGMKDAQQTAVVAALIEDLNFPIELVGVPTVREPSGLAKSSRNVRLSEKEKSEAPSLYQALQLGRKMVLDGETNPAIIKKEVSSYIAEQTTGEIDYTELLSYPDLRPVTPADRKWILAVAVQFSKARLIDNLIFDTD
ncbi:pantoate--beta-alanine ligase [Virgibacillus halophilus]|uniref:pantoate--beta-alanine ligase n=1 Tax=Tigheibacillus halophilus TaxID=361280 RepID=UPI0036368DA8